MEHLTSAALDQVLPRMGPALGAGSVTMISLEAIRERSGDRWPRKREQVAAFVERAFSRMASPADLIVGLNEAEFVAVQPEATRAAAAAGQRPRRRGACACSRRNSTTTSACGRPS